MPTESETRAAIDRTARRMVDHAEKTGQTISQTDARARARAAVITTENKKTRR